MTRIHQRFLPFTRFSRIMPVLLLWLFTAGPLTGGRNNEAIVSRMPGLEKLHLDSLRAMDARVLGELAARMEASRLEERTRELMSRGVTSIGSRELDGDGLSPVHRIIMETAAGLEEHGLDYVGSFRTQVAAPVSLDRLRRAEAREEPSRLLANGREYRVHPLWPNGPMPSLAPREGLKGPMVYCVSGEWEEINGKPLEGSIALLDFRGAPNMERLFSLGAIAVIVLEDHFVQYENADYLFTQTPNPFPRFYAGAAVREQLLALTGEDGTGPLTELHGGQVYENRPVESLIYHLPAADNLTYTVPDNLLIDWVAAECGVNGNDIKQENGLDGEPVSPGRVLRIPGNGGTYTVPEDGLWGIVARLHDLEKADLLQANQSISEEPLMAGTTLRIPSAEKPLGVFVPIDTASVVPDLPHGALAMANLAAALELMEFLCTEPNLRLRRGVVFAFVDGDTLGGQGSRLIAEFSYRLDNSFKSGSVSQRTGTEVLRQYRAAAEWFATGQIPESGAVLQWLLEDWLRPRFEEKRIAIAEDRISVLVGEKGSEDLPSLEELEADLARIAALRDQTVASPGSDADRLDRLMAVWEGPGKPDLQRFGLGKQRLRERLLEELNQEELARANKENNLETARRLREITLGAKETLSGAALGWRLDFADRAPCLGIDTASSNTLRIRETLTGDGFNRIIAPRMRKVAAFAASKAGWMEDFTFISEEDRSELSLTESPNTVVYDKFLAHANYVLLPLSGASDRRDRVDTPADTIENIHWNTFSLQARTAAVLIASGLESILDTQYQETLRKRDLSRIGGMTVQFNIRSGIDAKDPVPGTYVFLTESKKSSADRNAEGFFGFRRGILQISLLNGSYLMPPADYTYNPKPRIFAYKLDRDRALFTKVATQGQVGTKPQRNEFKYRIGEQVEKNLVLIDAYPRTFFIGRNPSNYKEIMGGQYSTNVLVLEDAVINGSPRDFAVDHSSRDFQEKDREAVTIYLPEGDRVRASIQSGLEYLFLLPGPVEIREDGKAIGRGILVGPDPETGDRNVLMPMTPYQIALGMWTLAANRLKIYQNYGISSKILQDAVDRSGDFISKAGEAMQEEDWQSATGYSREAWGIMVKNFPRVLKLGREAVFSVILLMALAVPGSWFLERLLIGSKGIVARLGGITAIFIAATLFLNAFHPAFKIALSPFIIVIAFTMILMSAIVIVLSYGRFEVVLRQFRSAGGEIQSEEISFMSSLSTAFSLGISNLKKRTFRTFLTTFTVIVLTFSIVGFVAVTGQDALTLVPQQIDRTVEGQPVDPLPPAYDGLLIRSHNWRDAGELKVSSIMAEFGARFPVTARAAYMEEEGGNSANREGVNQLLIRYRDRETVVNAISLFEPEETRFSGLQKAVSHNTWFRPGNPASGILPDRQVVILPDSAAQKLGLTADMLVDDRGRRLPDPELPVVSMMNRSWRVIGILDPSLANRIRDVNGRSLALVDFLKSGMATNTSPGELVTEGASYHMDWNRLAIVPMEARGDIQAKYRSIAIRIPEGTDFDGVLRDLALRLKTEFFAGRDGGVFMVVPRAKVDLAGVAKVSLPVILCILIVMNTMLGTVEERKGEVGMLGAIGLSPRQIAFLLFSESTVFSILGILLGTFGGLLFANIVNTINAGGGHFLTGLSFNFTSMISMTLATGTGLVVLLATLIPANKAAALAAPSGITEWVLPEGDSAGHIDFRLPFTLTRGNAVGMTAFLHQFLVNHNEPTSEDFNCREIIVTTGRAGGHPFIEIRTDMWLAPYDLDVAQHFTMRLHTGTGGSVFEVDLNLSRFSGSEENSRRTAYNLLNLVRKQFLLWRNLDPARRTEFIEKGAAMLKNLPKQD
ncbi:MAG: ABC transporter permease [Oceanipulchritudo sp.]